MKKIVLIAVLTVFGLKKMNSQVSYGVTAGYNNLIAKAKAEVNGVTNGGSNGASGFYVGFFVDFKVAEKLSIQPEVQYVNITEDGGSGNELVLPLMVKYYVADKFNLQAGPMLDFILDETNGVDAFGLGLALGGAFDATENLFISTKYSFGLTNRTKNAVTVPNVGTFDVTTKFDIFQIGLGYRF